MPPLTWLITGASRGFGFEIAAAALRAGAQVVATARHLESLQALKDFGGERCTVFAHDAADGSLAAGFVQQASEAFGGIDVLVNNAGQGLVAAVEETLPAQEAASMALHYHGPMALIRAVVPQMRERGAGWIINLGAAATHGNYAGFAAYGAAKAALECASEALRAEVQSFGINVSVIVPGPFRTGFIEHAPAPASLLYQNTVGRFAAVLSRMNGAQPGDPARAAELIVGLVNDNRLPFRLPIGAYAVKKLRDRATSFQRLVDEWTDAAIKADFNS